MTMPFASFRSCITSVSYLILFMISLGITHADLFAANDIPFLLNDPQAFLKKARFEQSSQRLIIKARAGLPNIQFEKIIKGQGARYVKRIKPLNMHVIRLPNGVNAQAVANLLKRNPFLQFVEIDKKISIRQVSNDPFFTYEWHLQKVGAPAAWDITQGEGIVIALLDTGVNANHEDLIGQLVPGWNLVDNNADTSDVHGHGTLVAGVLSARSNNALGIASVANRAKLMPVRIGDRDANAYLSTIADGIVWAADHGARVANVSFSPLANSEAVIAAAQYMQSKGGVVVVAAGNEGSQENIAQSPNLIVVSATDSSDSLTSISSFGSYVDLCAPGDAIVTTEWNGGYIPAYGTSFASPVVAGVTALMFSINPELQPSQAAGILASTATDLGTTGYDIYYGHGRVNAYAAVKAAADLLPRDTQAPTVGITSPTTAIVKGIVNVDVSASDNIGVTKVELYAKDVLVASDVVAPYQFSWDSTATQNGVAELKAFAYDAAGNVSSASLIVTVNNISVAPTRKNVALAANGAVASASSITDTGYSPDGTINGDRWGKNWGYGGGWRDGTIASYPDWLQVNFNGTKTIDEIDVFTLQDASSMPFEPTLTMTFTAYGITNFQVQYWNGSTWITVPGANISGNNKVWRKLNFAPISTNSIRILVTDSLGGSKKYSRIVELEAWGYDAP